MVQSKILKKEILINHFFLNRFESALPYYQKIISWGKSCEQVHGNKIAEVANDNYYPGVDGLMSLRKSIITIRTADCLPVFIYAAGKKVILALHAGWRGLLKGIINSAFQKISRYGIENSQIKVAIGPGIGVCCYQVDRTLIEKFKKIFPGNNPFYRKKEMDYFLDLPRVAVLQLLAHGVASANIDQINICTKCSSDFHSHRRDHSNQRNYNILLLK